MENTLPKGVDTYYLQISFNQIILYISLNLKLFIIKF